MNNKFIKLQNNLYKHRSTKQQIINKKIENLKLNFQNGNLETFDYLYKISELFENI